MQDALQKAGIDPLDTAAVEKFIAEQKYGMRVLLDEGGKAADIFSIRYLPTTYVIDADGVVAGQLVGGTTKAAVMKLVREAK